MQYITKFILVFSFLLLLPLAGIIILAPGKALAATINVTTTAWEDNDPGPDTGCSLPEAITAANTDTAYGGCNAGSGADTINVPAGTYTVIAAVPAITDSLSLLGSSEGGTIIQNIYMPINISGSNQTILVRDITMRNSASDGFNVNAASSSNYLITFDRVTVEGSEGRGIVHARNSGATGEVHINNSLIQNNFSGIYNSECTNIGTLYVTNTTIRDSLEGPGIYNECGHVVLDRVTISGNYNYDNEGGGIRSIGKLDMTNVTIFGNGSDFSGGGIALLAGSESYDDSIFTNVTIANNEAPDNGGIYFQGFYSSVEMHNTLIANNSGDQCTRGLGDGVAISPFSTNNLATDDSCSETPDNNFAETADAKLATSLTDNGGEAPIGSGGLGGNVLTLALLEGSPAIGSGDNEFCPVTDERDGSRPFGTTCDIGAFEARFASANPTTPGSAAAAGTLANTGQNIALFAGLAVVIIGSGLAIGRVTLTKTY